jgi:thioredoxin-like negative regulator of GroEL
MKAVPPPKNRPSSSERSRQRPSHTLKKQEWVVGQLAEEEKPTVPLKARRIEPEKAGEEPEKPTTRRALPEEEDLPTAEENPTVREVPRAESEESDPEELDFDRVAGRTSSSESHSEIFKNLLLEAEFSSSSGAHKVSEPEAPTPHSMPAGTKRRLKGRRSPSALIKLREEFGKSLNQGRAAEVDEAEPPPLPEPSGQIEIANLFKPGSTAAPEQVLLLDKKTEARHEGGLGGQAAAGLIEVASGKKRPRILGLSGLSPAGSIIIAPTKKLAKNGSGSTPKSDSGPRKLREPSLLPRPIPTQTRRIPRQPLPESVSSIVKRFWPLFLVVGLTAFCIATGVGIAMRRDSKARTSLVSARRLAQGHRADGLKKALEAVREAANLSARSGEVVAFAAALHGELAREFGESDLKRTMALVDEAQRLEAEQDPLSAEDLAVARAHLALATQTTSEATKNVLALLEAHPSSSKLRLLYGEALYRNGELEFGWKVLAELPADDPHTLLERARNRFAAGSPDEAALILQLASSSGLGDDQTALELAKFAVASGHREVKLLEKLSSLGQSSSLSSSEKARANLLTAMLQVGRSRRVEASSALAQALARRPYGDPEFAHLASLVLLRLHRLEEASQEGAEALRLGPEVMQYRVLAARVDLAMDRPRKALERLGNAFRVSSRSGRFDEGALVTYAEASFRAGMIAEAQRVVDTELSPSQPERRLLSARLLLAAKNPRGALRELPGLEREKIPLSEFHIVRGLAALQLGEPRETIRAMHAALRSDPTCAEALLVLGRLAQDRGDDRGALGFFAQAEKADPYLRQAKLELGRLSLRLGDFSTARALFDAVLEREDPEGNALEGAARAAVELAGVESSAYIQALRSRGDLQKAALLSARRLMTAGRTRAAAAELEKILEGKPGPELRVETLSALGQARRLLGEAEKQRAAELELLRLRADDPEAHLGLSELALASGQSKQALVHAVQAAQATRGRIVPYTLRGRIGVQLARVFCLKDQVGPAIAELDEVLELDPGHLDANLELGRIYASLDKGQRALRHLSSAFIASPQDRRVRTELKRVCRTVDQAPAICSEAGI